MAADRTRLVEALRADRSLSLGELAHITQLDESTIVTLLRQLEHDGLPMQKEGNSHFKLLDNMTPIDVGDLVSRLKSANFPFADRVVVLDTVDSTSDWLSREQQDGMDIHGKTCITEFQSAGRGRRGKSWRGSPYCHLMLSMGWRFEKEATEMAGLSLSIGVAIAERLKELTAAPVGLKWPNDLLCKERKLGGILVDLNTPLAGGTFAVIGIGINLREPRLDQLDTGQPVTDLASNAQGDLASRTTMIASVLGSVAHALERFGQHHFLPDQARFNALDVFSDRKVRAESEGRCLEGVGAGADEQGRYRLRCAGRHGCHGNIRGYQPVTRQLNIIYTPTATCPPSDFDLLIDHGNSRIKWAMAGAQNWSAGEAIDYRGEETDFGPWAGLGAPQRIVVSNSAGPAAFAHLENWCQSHWQLKPQLLRAKPAEHGVSNSYPEPETLGSDRWLALIAARQLFNGPLAVIDCGTAVTVDALSGEGKFLGGVISAGPKISAGALIERAAHLDRDKMCYSGVFNTDTASAVTAGALIFAVGGIEKVLTEFRPELGDGFTILMTGGWAQTFAPLMSTEVTLYPDLVFTGNPARCGQSVMRWILTLLVMANVALYLWATQLSPKAELGLPEAQAGHNLEAMELLSEESIVVGARADCLRIGPFSTEQTLSAGRRLLVNKGYGLAQQRTAAREVHAYQVLAGPFRSDIARDNARMRLQEKGVSTRDLAYGDDKILLLRDYARKSQAEAFAASLDALEIPVLVKLQARTLGPLYWLDVPDVVTPERKQEFAELKWGDAMTEVTPIPCPKSG